MRLAFHAPFKPLGHPRPSGDLTIQTHLVEFLRGQGHALEIVSRFRSRWAFWQPWTWPRLYFERRQALAIARRFKPDMVLAYHVYWKAPDLIGPWLAGRLGVPYVIFQAAFSTKRRRSLASLPGYLLNRRGLTAARAVFVNRLADRENLIRLLPEDRVAYVPPGIHPDMFVRDAAARARLREQWGAGETPVILSAAMFRDDVKTQGLAIVLRALASLGGRDFRLVLAGDGVMRGRLEKLAGELLPGRVRFLGKVARERLYEVYSAADIFAFPGINESLGMVYLEAQSCGLPVVAFDNGGIPEVVDRDRTGLLTQLFDEAGFAAAVAGLLDDPARREAMGRTGAAWVRENRDLARNYRQFEAALRDIAAEARGGPTWKST